MQETNSQRIMSLMMVMMLMMMVMVMMLIQIVTVLRYVEKASLCLAEAVNVSLGDQVKV